MSDFGDTEDENLKLKEKNLKRMYPVSYGLQNRLDLKNQIKVGLYKLWAFIYHLT